MESLSQRSCCESFKFFLLLNFHKIRYKTQVYFTDYRGLKVSYLSNPSQCAIKLTLEQFNRSHLCPRSWLFVIETLSDGALSWASTLLNRTTIRKNKGTNIIILPRLYYPCSVLIIKVPSVLMCLSSMLTIVKLTHLHYLFAKRFLN